MKCEDLTFPVKKVSEIILTNSDTNEMKNKSIKSIDLKANKISEVNCEMNKYSSQIVPAEVKSRYTFSNYIIDPNKFCFKKVVRGLALVKRFIRHLKDAALSNTPITRSMSSKTGQQTTQITDDEIKDAEESLYRKAKVKKFVKESQIQEDFRRSQQNHCIIQDDFSEMKR